MNRCGPSGARSTAPTAATPAVAASFANASRAAYKIGFPEAGWWRVRFNSDWQGYDPEFGQQDVFDVEAKDGEYDGMPFHGEIALGPYGVVILSQDREG